MAGKGRGGDGLTYLGVRDGKKWWRARMVWMDADGERRDERETFAADSRPLAVQERARLLAERMARARAGIERCRVEKACDEYLDSIEAHGTRLSREPTVKRFKAAFQGRWIDTVATRELQAWLTRQVRLDGDKLSRGSLRNFRATIVSIWEHAQFKGYIETADVARAVIWRKGGSGRTREEALAENAAAQGEEKRSFTSDEAVDFLADLREHEADIFPLMVAQFILGARFAESSAIPRDCLDPETGIVFVAWSQVRGVVGPTKGKRRRKAGLGRIGLEIVREHLRRMDELKWPGYQDLVFPRRPEPQASARSRRTGEARSISPHWAYTTVYGRLIKAFERLGFDMANATHAARHTMNSLASEDMARANLSESLLFKVGGWSSQQIAATYRHPADAEVISLADVVERRLFKRSESVTTSGIQGGDEAKEARND
jgi:hypothetical protein